MRTRNSAQGAPPPPPPPPRRSTRVSRGGESGDRRTGGTLVSPRGESAGRDDVDWEHVQHPPQATAPPARATNQDAARIEAPRVEQVRRLDRQVVGIGNDQARIAERVDQETQTTDSDGHWVLKIRVPIAPPPPTRRQRGPHDSNNAQPLSRRYNPRNAPVLSIYITPYMTVDTLSACILQALLHHPLTSSTERQSLFFDRQDRLLVGLFRESNGVFVSLNHILSTNNISERREVYSPNLPPPPPPRLPPVTPWWYHLHMWLLLLVPPAVASFLYVKWDETCSFTIRSAEWWYSLTVHTPLAELYRYGPWFLGWEGDSLPSICSRITYHGDPSFWYRNLEECERIYAAKEEAWLRLARPMVWALWVFLAIVVGRFVVWEMLKPPPPPRQPNGPPIDRDMIDLYRAWQIILRQFHRGGNAPGTMGTNHQQHQQQARGHTAAANNNAHQTRDRSQGNTLLYR